MAVDSKDTRTRMMMMMLESALHEAA